MSHKDSKIFVKEKGKRGLQALFGGTRLPSVGIVEW